MSYNTYQDFEKAGDIAEFVKGAIAEHKASELYRTACIADEYDHQQNTTINSYVKTITNALGMQIADVTASNNRITSNFFHRLNTQRCTYSMGNGISFGEDIKGKLGEDCDTTLFNAAYYALIHGVSYVFLNVNKLYFFKVTEFKALHDRETDALRAGIRFWQFSPTEPLFAVLYEADGYTKFIFETDSRGRIIQEKRAYKLTVQHISATDTTEVVGGENYGEIPIVPLWGSKLRQSTLVGLQQAIDSYDLIRSGFANDLTDCAQIYWIIKNAGGMSEADLSQFRERLLFRHIATVNADEETGGVTPYTQEIPFQARTKYLEQIRAGIYEDFGGLDVHTIAAGATNDHIEAAYQPLDENADDFEYQIITCVKQLLALQGIQGEIPLFKRNRIANEKEQVEKVMLAAQYLDRETIIKHLPFISVDEVEDVLSRAADTDVARFGAAAEVE